MFSLVANYSDSDSDNSGSDAGSSVSAKVQVQAQKPSSMQLEINSEELGKNDRTSDGGIEIEDDEDDFVYNSRDRDQIIRPFADFQNYEEDEDEEDEEDEEASHSSQSTRPKPQLLSNPFRNFDTGEVVVKGASVFQIPFLEQEVKRSAALERHVKMTEAAGSQQMINGKKICWNYRKGKCRFGHNCTFAHDSDIQQLTDKDLPGKTKAISPVLNSGDPQQLLLENTSISNETNSSSVEYDESIVASSAHLSTSKSSSISSSSVSKSIRSDLSPDRTGSDPNTSNSTWKHRGKGKKRPGLSQSINPSKKVMKTYYQTQTQP